MVFYEGMFVGILVCLVFVFWWKSYTTQKIDRRIASGNFFIRKKDNPWTKETYQVREIKEGWVKYYKFLGDRCDCESHDSIESFNLKFKFFRYSDVLERI